MSKKIGFCYWSTKSEDEKAIDPAFIWLNPLFKMLRLEGYEPVWVDPTTTAEGIRNASLDEIDMLFVYWRWQLPDIERYRTRNAAYAFQMKALTEASWRDIPVVVYDCDLMIEPTMRQFLLSDGVHLKMPAFFPLEGYETLHYPMVYRIGERGSHQRHGVVYVGNNYSRYDMARQYLNFPNGMSTKQLRLPLAADPCFKVYGNWMEPSSFRETPEQVRRDFPNVEFPGLLPQDQTIDVLRQAKATVHIAKPEYADIGFIALRWFEAVAAGTPAFVPVEWNLPEQFSMHLSSDAYDIAIDLDLRPEVVLHHNWQVQKRMISELTFDPWMTMFKELLG